VLGRSQRDLLPKDAGLDAGDARLGVDLDAPHPHGLHEDGVGERVERGREVPRALDGHAKAVLAGVVDDRDDVVDRLGEDDGRRPLVGGKVPGEAGLVPGGVAGPDDLAVEEVAKIRA
jgi:hypothetical protein